MNHLPINFFLISSKFFGLDKFLIEPSQILISKKDGPLDFKKRLIFFLILAFFLFVNNFYIPNPLQLF